MKPKDSCIICSECGSNITNLNKGGNLNTSASACPECGCHEPAEAGIIYVITTPFIPDVVIIICTVGLLKQFPKLLYTESVPDLFYCHFAAQVENVLATTQLLHELFSDERVDPTEPIFRIAPERVILAITLTAHTVVTLWEDNLSPEGEEAEAIDLDTLGIHPGAGLTFVHDPDVKATVVEGNLVEYQGHIMTLSEASRVAFLQRGGAHNAKEE